MKYFFNFSKKRKAIILSASFLFIFIGGCKEDGQLTPEFADNTSFALFTDSIKINTNTVKGDSVLADQISTGLVGTYRDSAFGKVTSSIYMQPLLSSNFLVFGEDDETFLVDSVVLSLVYSNWHGDTSIPQTFEAFRLDEVLDEDENYFSSDSVKTIPIALGSKTFIPSPISDIVINEPNASGGIDTISYPAQFRIRLNDDLGTEILSKSGEIELSNNANFVSFFKGIKLTPNESTPLMDNQKAILYFALTASQTKMSVFYTAVDPQGDSTKKLVDFPINSSSVRFNTFKHDYSISAVQSSLIDKKNDSIYSYAEAMAGVETVITFPELKERFGDKNIIINKAELVIPAFTSGSYAQFGLAESMILASRDASGRLQFIPDFFEDSDYFGGEYNEITDEYRFNIARYIQGFINGLENENGLTLLVTGSAVKAERVVILNQGNQGRKITLNLYYSNTQ